MSVSLAPQPASAAVNELSTCYANFTFADQNGNPYIPTSISYRLDAPEYNTQVLDWTSFTGSITSSISIPITSAQNAKQTEVDPKELRKVTIRVGIPGGGTRYDKTWYTLIALPEATLT